MNNWLQGLINTVFFSQKDDFKQLFAEKEFYALNGQKLGKLWFLTMIVFLSLLAVSFSFYSLSKLENRMSNPFTNWVDLVVNTQVSDSIESIKLKFNQPEILDKFNVTEVTGYVRTYQRFYNQNGKDIIGVVGRSMEKDSKLSYEILKPENVIYLNSLISQENDPYSIVITNKLLKKLDYNANTNYIVLYLSEGPVLLAVKAIVKSLPNLCEFAISNELYNGLIDEKSNFINFSLGSNVIHFFSNIEDPNKIENIINEVYQMAPPQTIEKVKSIVSTANKDSFHFYDATFSFSQLPEAFLIKKFDSLGLVSSFVLPYYEQNTTAGNKTIEKSHYLAFHFKNLNEVRKFNDYMKSQFLAEISMNQIEDKENFSKVSILAYSIILFLFVLSLFTILSFINNLLDLHFEKIKQNLGTFMSFGLEAKKIEKLYSFIVVLSLLIAIILAFVLLGILAFFSAIKNWDYGVLIDYRLVLIAVAIILIIFYFISKKLKSILQNSPGDLIYKRI
jgi:hypothetical protein